MPDPEHTSSHRPTAKRAGKAGLFVVGVLIAMFVLIFLGRNLWHVSDDGRPDNVQSRSADGMD